MALPDSPYGVSTPLNRVEGWSVVRLPFQPKGDSFDYRELLRSGLRQMTLLPGQHLRCEYAAPSTDFVDLENVLLYNVGSGAYSHLLASGVECHRLSSIDGLHRVAYYGVDEWAEAPPERTQARFEFMLSSKPSSTAAWWWLFRQNLRATSSAAIPSEFFVNATLSGNWGGGRVASTIKSMFDGMVSALHVHDGSGRSDVVERLQSQGLDAAWDLLTDDSNAVLGQRRLVRPQGQSLIWNPADELCSGFQVQLQPAESDTVSISVHSA